MVIHPKSGHSLPYWITLATQQTLTKDNSTTVKPHSVALGAPSRPAVSKTVTVITELCSRGCANCRPEQHCKSHGGAVDRPHNSQTTATLNVGLYLWGDFAASKTIQVFLKTHFHFPHSHSPTVLSTSSSIDYWSGLTHETNPQSPSGSIITNN